MKLRRYTVVVAIGLTLIAPALIGQKAGAHVLESDGGVAAVLHMPPDDVPIAGDNTYVGLAFSSDDSAFDITAYDTSVEIQRDSVAVQTTTLTTSSESSRDGNTTVIFPVAGVYRVIASGTPKQAGVAFRLVYSVRVSPPAGSKTVHTTAGPDFWILSCGSLVLLAVIARYNIRQGKRYR